MEDRVRRKRHGYDKHRHMIHRLCISKVGERDEHRGGECREKWKEGLYIHCTYVGHVMILDLRGNHLYTGGSDRSDAHHHLQPTYPHQPSYSSKFHKPI
jgi:hypothetical protein